MIDGSAWVSAHAFFQDDLDLLVTHVVAPLTEELAAEGMAGEFFFLRYWDGGPHLRLRVLPAPGASRGEVERLIGERFGGYLSGNPSADHLSAAQYAALAPELARKEDMSSWTTRPYPNNSVSFIAYRPEYERYGHGAAMQAVERHFAESSRIALPVVTQAVPPKRRATLALGCILAAWFVGCADPAGLRTWLGNRYRGDAAQLPTLSRVVELARTARRLAEGGPDSPGDGALACWTRSVAGLREALSAGQAGAGDVLRVVDVCAHLLCNRLGVSLVTEPVLRELAAKAIEAMHRERN